MYSILGRGFFCFNYCLNSAWHGGDQFVALLRWYEAQVSLTVAFSSSAFFGLLFLIFLLTIPHRFSMFRSGVSHIFSMFRSGEFAGQSSTPTHGHLTSGAFGSVGRWQILLENEISIFKKLVSKRKHEVLQHFFVNGCSDVGFQKTQWTNTSRWHCTPDHHWLWKLNTGLQATWAMSFSTLPPDSRTLVSKWNTKLALIWKEDFGPLGNSPVLLLLAQVRRLWRQLYPNSSTRLCVVLLMSWPQTQSIPCEVHPNSWLFLTILIKLRFSRLVVHLFLPHFFLPLNFLLSCLDTALCEQLLW